MSVPKRVVSVSLGSSRRDKTVTENLLGETFEISRVGVDGDEKKFMQRLGELDGTVDAFGFGGMDRYLWSEGRRYEFRAAKKLLAPAIKTPVLDGSGLKNTLERETVRWLAENGVVDFRTSKTLMVCGVDRFGMSEALSEQGGEIVFGDLMFSLDIALPLKGRKIHRSVARALLPLVVQMPLSLLYPMGEKQNQIVPKWESWYRWADVIAGDFLYIRRHLPTPESGYLNGKIILTNTTTKEDEMELAKRGVHLLITTTPQFDGRSFGTNVMEAVLVAHNNGKSLDESAYLQTLAGTWLDSQCPIFAGGNGRPCSLRKPPEIPPMSTMLTTPHVSPDTANRTGKPLKFAFIIHPLDARRDIAGRGGVYSVARYLPTNTVEALIKHKSPMVASPHYRAAFRRHGAGGRRLVHRLPAYSPATDGRTIRICVQAADAVRGTCGRVGRGDYRLGRVYLRRRGRGDYHSRTNGRAYRRYHGATPTPSLPPSRGHGAARN